MFNVDIIGHTEMYTIKFESLAATLSILLSNVIKTSMENLFTIFQSNVVRKV